ncbi:MAG: outer membrane beta-barrel protein [Gammaproteobacteria bacterium]|nr:outer membrane beta-barrel protein [Gammaproteobacteria bacterium]
MYYKRISLLLLTLLFSGIALAENSSNYIGINAATFDSKNSTTEYDGGMINFGYDLNNFIALEIAAGGSSTETDKVTNDTSKIDYAASAFIRFNVRFSGVTVYLLGGYSQVESTSTTGTTSITTTDSSNSYGYGIDFYGTRDLALSVRRVEFFDNDEVTGNRHLGATMVGITYYFDEPKIHSRY